MNREEAIEEIVQVAVGPVGLVLPRVKYSYYMGANTFGNHGKALCGIGESNIRSAQNLLGEAMSGNPSEQGIQTGV